MKSSRRRASTSWYFEKEAAMQNRAYSVLEIKSVDEDKRIVRGVATTPTVDRVGDIIDPLGVKFENPLAFLWQHRHDQPIGSCKFSKPTKNGIDFEAEIAKIDEPGTLKDRLDEAWQSIKTGLVRAVSIGFRPLEYAFMETGGIRYNECEVYELSAVTIPANSDALITQIKSIDAQLRHDAGVPDPEIPAPPEPAATGKKVRVVKLDDKGRDRPPFVVREIKRA
jgi:HK97 family phage prohead protease